MKWTSISYPKWRGSRSNFLTLMQGRGREPEELWSFGNDSFGNVKSKGKIKHGLCRIRLECNVVAYSDGETGHGFGIPYFYIAKLEPEGGALQNGTKVALTVSEYALGTCTVDVQDPSCKSVTLSGQLQLITLDNPEVKLAQVALFTKHPGLQGFPQNQNFKIYKIALEYIYVVNDFGFPKYLTPQPYLQVPPM